MRSETAREDRPRSEPAIAPWVADIPTEIPPEPPQAMALEILDRCRGEGPANCVARCPLHVDARAYVQLAREGKYQDALQKVREKLPFPGILGYVCAHPCEMHCKRVDDDTPVRIRDIKRFLADREEGTPQHILDAEPARAERVAVVGAGPAGLIAAHDLTRAGYTVTVFERDERIGGCLVNRIPAFRLPRNVIERDLSIIDALGIEVRTGVEIGRDMDIDALRKDYDAVLLLIGYAGGVDLLKTTGDLLARSARETVWCDRETAETALEGVFAGGDAFSGPSTVIQSLASGRRAAESAMRFLQGRDLREDRESPLPARLLWTLEIDEAERRERVRQPVMLTPHNEAMTEAEVREESERCLDCECGLCVTDCEFLKKYGESPKDLARMVLRGMEHDEVNKMAYSCNLCELCKTVCPENLDTGEMLMAARDQAVAQGVGPRREHKGTIGYWKNGVSNTFCLTMNEPGRSRSKRMFFTGCSLPATAPSNALFAYEQLRKYYPETGVLMRCCGAPVEFLGMEEQFHNTIDEIVRDMESCGADELVTACPDCSHTLLETLPDGIKVTSAWDLLADKWQPEQPRTGEKISIHDSCKARHMPSLHGSVRKLIEKSGATIEDVEYSQDMARCCGFGGMMAPVDSALCKQISQRRGGETELPLLTYCSGCRIALRGAGKEAIHLLDFLRSPDWKASAKKAPTNGLWQYANRLWTKWNFKRLRPLSGKAGD